MLYFLIAFGICALALMPLLVARRGIMATGLGVLGTLLLGTFFYLGTPGFAGPMFGEVLFLLAACSTGVAAFTLMTSRATVTPVVPLAVPVLSWLAYFGILFFGSEILNASQYRALIGEMETRVWTQDIQPKDPAHVGLVQDENALYVAKKVVGELGTIGSQFQIREDSLTLQAIKGELWYIVPLDFAGWRAWNNTGTSVGYIMVHAEDPDREPVVKQLPKNKQFTYTPGAYFGHDLIRHLRLDGGHMRVNLSGTHLELDEAGEPWWITSVLEPSIGQFGDMVKGVLITNPVTGESKFAPLGQVPEWVDRVIPISVTKNYLKHWGEYVHDWMNSWWGKRDLTEPENPSLVYSSAHDAMFVTGITSQNAKDDSLVGMVYTHTRTGKSIFYEVKGGATDEAVRSAVEKFQDVQFKHLHAGKNPRLYNHYGRMASVVPLLNENHAYSGVAIVDINKIQRIAVGRDLQHAMLEFQKLIGQSGDHAHVDNTRTFSVIEGVVTRFKQDISTTGSTYYVVIEGFAHALTGGAGQFPLLPLAQAGDRVKIEYVASGQSVVPMRSFKNLTLPLETTKGEAAAEERRVLSRDANDAKPVRRDIANKLNSATPDDLRKIEEALKK